MSGLEVAGRVLAVLPGLMKTLEDEENHFKLGNITIELQSLKLELRAGYEKFKIWQERWLGQQDLPDTSSKALWGAEGWATVQRLLENIEQISKQLEEVSRDIHSNADPQSRSRLKLLRVRLKRRHDLGNLKELKERATRLNLAVDAIWLYSETVFDSLHGFLASGLETPVRDFLLQSALHSRSGSHQLFKLCSNDSMEWLLELDLIPASNLENGSNGRFPFYRLLGLNPKNSMQLRKLVVENLRDNGASGGKFMDVISRDDSEFQLSEISSGVEGKLIPVERESPNPPSRLRIEKFSDPVILKSRPGSLSILLKQLRETSTQFPKERFSVGAKVELAYQLAESGLFLIGTPWLSLLNGQNLLRLKDASQAHSKFVLKGPSFGLSDISHDDSEGFSPAKQLFHIGVLLMEIALEYPSASESPEDASHPIDLWKQLPLVEQSMGLKYGEATAFCLQHRRHRERFDSLKMSEGSYPKDWEQDLLELLRDYYSQVFLRLWELRAIDIDSEYRSRKSMSIKDS